jgi:multidrug efflux pump subunit AcrA (membrane-fusion protein)
VQLGKAQGDQVEIISGLKPNDKIISEGVNLLTNGIKVKIQE